jgi:hypothetical protein
MGPLMRTKYNPYNHPVSAQQWCHFAGCHLHILEATPARTTAWPTKPLTTSQEIHCSWCDIYVLPVTEQTHKTGATSVHLLQPLRVDNHWELALWQPPCEKALATIDGRSAGERYCKLLTLAGGGGRGRVKLLRGVQLPTTSPLARAGNLQYTTYTRGGQPPPAAASAAAAADKLRVGSGE